MTAKNKAKELVEHMAFSCRECDYESKAKQCAIIAVDEILSLLWSVKTDVEYWSKVKKEIKLL
jgi:hypothetical protein